MRKKDDGVKISMLEKEHYSHSKVKNRMHLLTLDTSYFNCTEKEPNVLVNINTAIRLNENEFEYE